MQLHVLPILTDNYVWLLSDQQQQGIIVDPGAALPVIEFLTTQQIEPIAILLTHHHQDHIGGVAELQAHYPHIKVHGPQEVSDKHALSLQLVSDNQQLTIGSFTFKVIAVPGHTLGHVAYYSASYLFPGDTLFSAGCGRVFEGTHQQMFHSINRLAQLENETLICCAHEYTLSNLKFSHAILPTDRAITAQLAAVETMRKAGEITLPTTLEQEKQINLFLRCDDPALQDKLQLTNSEAVFSELRTQKNNF